jgi:hypothetical protein
MGGSLAAPCHPQACGSLDWNFSSQWTTPHHRGVPSGSNRVALSDSGFAVFYTFVENDYALSIR